MFFVSVGSIQQDCSKVCHSGEGRLYFCLVEILHFNSFLFQNDKLNIKSEPRSAFVFINSNLKNIRLNFQPFKDW